jgi:DNA-directed RNA polymerase specialized sigma24 family protein
VFCAEQMNGSDSLFAVTNWKLVLQASRGEDSHAREAWNQLSRIYWYPIYSFVRRRGLNREDAEDLTQSFFEHMYRRHALAQVGQGKGRFRSFLLASLRNFLNNAWDHAQAQKRGGGHLPLSLDAASAETRYRLEPVDAVSADVVFEKNYAIALLEQVLARLQSGHDQIGMGWQFERLKDKLMADPDAPGYELLASQMGVTCEAARKKVCDLRRRFRKLFREEVARTVSDPSEIDEELRYLRRVLNS